MFVIYYLPYIESLSSAINHMFSHAVHLRFLTLTAQGWLIKGALPGECGTDMITVAIPREGRGRGLRKGNEFALDISSPYSVTLPISYGSGQCLGACGWLGGSDR